MNIVTIDRIKKLSKERKRSLAYLCSQMNVARVYFNDIVKSGRDIPDDKLAIIATELNTTVAYLKGETDQKEKTPDVKSNVIFLDGKEIYMIPVFESVSAGFGAYADSSVLEYKPIHFFSHSEAENTICVKVIGDSMYPKIEDGDTIQIYKTDSVDSGTIAVVLLDGDEALVKKVVYGGSWIELHSINPMYPVIRFEKEDVLRLRVLGKVTGIFKRV